MTFKTPGSITAPALGSYFLHFTKAGLFLVLMLGSISYGTNVLYYILI